MTTRERRIEQQLKLVEKFYDLRDAAIARLGIEEVERREKEAEAYYSPASERHAKQTVARAKTKARAANDEQWAKYLAAMREKNS
jgi:hypothetical protein